MDWLTQWEIPVGAAAKAAFDWLKAEYRTGFKAFGDTIEAGIEGFADILQTIPALVLVAAFVALAWAIHRRWQPCVIVLACLLFIINQGYWDRTVETLALVTFVCAICMAIGVPIGVAAAHRPRLYAALQPVLDLMQTLPAPVYLIPFVILFGIGVVPALFASIIFVVPSSIRLTHLGVSTTPKALIEAATAFGATKRQVLWKVELPYAFPQIMTGLNQTIMFSLSMVVISAWVGAAGLGVPVVEALNRVRADQGFEAGAVIVALAIALDRMLRVEHDGSR
jgi:glycine betaine/proline transport system permease protein